MGYPRVGCPNFITIEWGARPSPSVKCYRSQRILRPHRIWTLQFLTKHKVQFSVAGGSRGVTDCFTGSSVTFLQGKLLSSPPETYPLGISLTALAAAVRGPGGCAQEGFPNVWVGYFKLCLYLCHVGVWKLNMLVAKPIICGPLTHHLRQRCKNVAVCDIQWSRTQKVQSRHRRLTAVQ